MSFLIEKAVRFDVKGKRYIDTPAKYYFEDIGLRNARLNFRQQEENHIMENIIYTELRSRGYRIDIGVVETFDLNASGKREHKMLEIDFIANKGDKKSLTKLNDFFKKIVIVKDDIKPRTDEQGIIIIGILDFLLDETILEKI